MNKKYYTKKQLQTLTKFKDKFINSYPHHHEYWNEKLHRYETVYEIRGISSTIRENYQTVEEILNN